MHIQILKQSQHKHPRLSQPLSLLILLLLYCQAMTKQTNFCDQIHTALHHNDQNKLKEVLQQAEKAVHVPCFLQMVPKYYWAQNMSHIMVKIQFLNSADTSACSRVLSVKKDLDHNYFSVRMICLQSSQILRYQLKVKTFMPMNYYHSVWKVGQQNTIILQTLKSPSPYFWSTLYAKGHLPARKPMVWWKVQQKYRQNIGNFIYELQPQQSQQDISAYVRGKRQSKKTKLTEQYDPSSNIYLYCNQNNPFELGSWIF